VKSPLGGVSTMTDTEKSDSQRGVRSSIVAVALVGLVGAVTAYWLGGMGSARSVAIGATIAVANLWILAQMVRGFLSGKGNVAPWGVIAVLKFVVLFGAMYVLVKSRLVSLLPCAFGFGALPVGIVLAELFGGRRDVGGN
jgi:hypothetical protein